jgi:hypothetical protein
MNATSAAVRPVTLPDALAEIRSGPEPAVIVSALQKNKGTGYFFGTKKYPVPLFGFG